MMYLEKIKQLVKEHAKLNKLDEIEVELVLQIGLKDELKLPVLTEYMDEDSRKGAFIDVKEALSTIEKQCTHEAFEQYLKDWEPWQQLERQKSIKAFEALPIRHVESIEVCGLSYEKTQQMVLVGPTYVDYDLLCKAYINNGNDPFTNLPLDWSSVIRLHVTEEVISE